MEQHDMYNYWSRNKLEDGSYNYHLEQHDMYNYWSRNKLEDGSYNYHLEEHDMHNYWSRNCIPFRNSLSAEHNSISQIRFEHKYSLKTTQHRKLKIQPHEPH
jgi:hypothetical protein